VRLPSVLEADAGLCSAISCAWALAQPSAKQVTLVARIFVSRTANLAPPWAALVGFLKLDAQVAAQASIWARQRNGNPQLGTVLPLSPSG
jgi:hypothetical protein